MKYYTITVNGNTYEVSVEEITWYLMAPTTGAPHLFLRLPYKRRPAPTYRAPAPKNTSGTESKTKVNSPMPGKILSLKASVGETIKKGGNIIPKLEDKRNRY